MSEAVSERRRSARTRSTSHRSSSRPTPRGSGCGSSSRPRCCSSAHCSRSSRRTACTSPGPFARSEYAHADKVLGSVNTAVLLVSSTLVACSVHMLRAGRIGRATKALLAGDDAARPRVPRHQGHSSGPRRTSMEGSPSRAARMERGLLGVLVALLRNDGPARAARHHRPRGDSRLDAHRAAAGEAHRRRTTTGSRSGPSTGTSSTSCGSSCGRSSTSHDDHAPHHHRDRRGRARAVGGLASRLSFVLARRGRAARRARDRGRESGGSWRSSSWSSRRRGSR